MLHRVGYLFCILVFASILLVSPLFAQSTSIGTLEVDYRELPADFSGNLLTLTPITLEGDTLRFLADSGGGSNMLYAGAHARLGLDAHGEMDVQMPGNEGPVMLTRMPDFDPGHAIPAPMLLPPVSWQLLVVDPPYDFIEGDGFLGRTWFAGRIWLLDYPGETIGQVVGIDASTIADEHRLALGFQQDEEGRRTMHFPRITIEVDGEEIEMLFDTGATTVLSNEARDAIPNPGSGEHATSFIAASVFNTWRENNPEWQVIDGADTVMNMPMIKVPEITIAGHTVGPVWFTMRPDANLREYMSQMTDRPVDGALGGSALKYFRIIIDYPNAWAAFDVADEDDRSEREEAGS